MGCSLVNVQSRLPLVDHGYLHRLPSIILICQVINSVLLPPSLSSTSEASIHYLCTLCLLHHLLLGRLLQYHRPLQHEEQDLGHHRLNELFCLRRTYLRHWRPRSSCRRLHTCIPGTHGIEASYFVVTEDLLAIRFLGWCLVISTYA